MGSPEEFAAMLRFVTEHRIEPAIDRIFPLDQAVAAHQRLLAAEQLGKIVLRHD
jgi:D-arabinose 1-dehydrogenase-like Zn-dependent alcohol dehydrogenase